MGCGAPICARLDGNSTSFHPFRGSLNDPIIDWWLGRIDFRLRGERTGCARGLTCWGSEGRMEVTEFREEFVLWLSLSRIELILNLIELFREKMS